MMAATTHCRRSSLGNTLSVTSTGKKVDGASIGHHSHKHHNRRHCHRRSEGQHSSSSRRGSQHSTMSSGGGLLSSSTVAAISATNGTVHKKLSSVSLVNTRAFWPYPSAVAIAAAMGASGGSASGIGGHECQSPAACASSLELEALAAVHRLSVAVRDISVSEMLPRTSQLIFVNVTTLEGQPYCLELTHKGWRVTSLRSDCMQGDFTRMELFTTYYDSIYDLMSVISPAYKRHLIQCNASSNTAAAGGSGGNQSSASSAASSDAATATDAAAAVDSGNECGPVEQLALTDGDLSAATAAAAAECVCGDIMTAAAAAALHHAPLCGGCCSSADRAGAAVAIRNALATAVRRHSLTLGTADDGCGRTAVDALLNERLRLMERYNGGENSASDDAADDEDEEDAADDSSAASSSSSAVVEKNRRQRGKAAKTSSSDDNNSFSCSSASQKSRSAVMDE